jgi:2-oxoglutarate dehydrogenase E2 component (dihydrolipoamide succinyltransferase)
MPQIDVAVNAPEAGKILEFLANEEDTVTVGQDLLKIEPGSAPAGGEQKPPETAKDESKAPADPQQEPGSKQAAPEETRAEPAPPKKDESKPAPQQKAHESTKTPSKQKTEPTTTSKAFGNREERRVKMNRMRLRIAERLKESQNTAASLTTFNEIDMSNLMEMRKLYKDAVIKKTGVKLGFMSAFSRAVIKAMEDVPAVNASIEGPNGGDTIVYRDYVDISVAVATEKGLVTPVVRNAESLDMIGIEKAIAELGVKARENKLTIEDMVGGTFTISNGGVFGYVS